MTKVRIAVAQVGSELGNVGSNVDRIVETIEEAAKLGCKLLVLPECVLTGYCFKDRSELEAGAIASDSDIIEKVLAVVEHCNIFVAFGYFEKEGEKVYNTVQLAGPGGTIGVHRKRHLPFLGGDMFADLPDEMTPSVFETPFANIGLAICYEIRFPEVVRTLMLSGAEIVLLPTNWPEQSRMLAEHFSRVRAAENMVYFAAANRNDAERNTKFIGESQIVDPLGEVVVNAGHNTGIFYTDIDVDKARNKKIVFEVGIHEIAPIADRMPQSYRT